MNARYPAIGISNELIPYSKNSGIKTTPSSAQTWGLVIVDPLLEQRTKITNEINARLI